MSRFDKVGIILAIAFFAICAWLFMSGCGTVRSEGKQAFVIAVNQASFSKDWSATDGHCYAQLGEAGFHVMTISLPDWVCRLPFNGDTFRLYCRDSSGVVLVDSLARVLK